jgi:hypothetical protein
MKRLPLIDPAIAKEPVARLLAAVQRGPGVTSGTTPDARAGNENGEFDEAGYLCAREDSINDLPLSAEDRSIFGPRSSGDLTELPLR